MQLDTNTTVEPDSTAEHDARNGLSLNSFMGIFFMCFYIVVYTTSSVGNTVVLYICAKNGRNAAAFQPARTGFFNLYIANLAIADLLFTQLTIFDAVYAILDEWTMGAMLCKLQGFLVELCYSAGILTLIAISRERLKSMSDLRMKSRLQRIKERKTRSKIVWILAILLCSPLFYAYHLTEEISHGNIIQCTNDAWSHVGRRIYYSITAVILFILPLMIMVWTQLKIKRVFKSQVAPTQQIAVSMRARQRKASRMLGAVTIVFFAFWSPFILTRTLRYFSWYEGVMIWKLSQLLTIASAAANPFIYSFYSTHFRVYIKRFVTCRCRLIAAANDSGEGSTVNSLY